MRLEGFDTETSSSRIAFSVTEVDGRFVFTPPAQDAAYDDRSQPWDLTRIRVDQPSTRCSCTRSLVASPDEPGGFAGATIPVLSDDVEPEVAGTRVVLSPAAYDVDRSARGQLLRHEITHEAMGFGIGDNAWFAEGGCDLRRVPVAATPAMAGRRERHCSCPARL